MDVSLKKTNESGAIWIRGLCGRIAYDVSASDLIELGFLKRPTIHFVRYDGPNLPVAWSAKTIELGIVHNAARDDQSVRIALEQVEAGRRVLIDVERIPHGRLLTDALKAVLPPGRVSWLCGSHVRSTRVAALQEFASGRCPVLVSTLLGEGNDIPLLEVVIVGGGGKSGIQTMQRLRNLTAAPGKGDVHVYDFADFGQRHLQSHSAARLATYRGERAFCVRIEDRRSAR